MATEAQNEPETSLRPDYTIAAVLNEKNEAYREIFRAPADQKPNAACAFVKAADKLFDALSGPGTSYSYMMNSQAVRAQTMAVFATEGRDLRECQPLRSLASKLGIRDI
jgi:hypothetical protein